MASTDYVDLNSPRGRDNAPGIKQTVWLAPMDYFDTISDVVDPASFDGDAVTIADPHVFKAAKGWIQMYTTVEKSNFTAEAAGDVDAEMVQPKLTFFHPGDDEAAAAMARRVKNDRFIVIFETQNGKFIQIGAKNNGAKVVGTYDMGTVGNGGNGWTFEATSYDNFIRFYGAGQPTPLQSDGGAA
ncbi:hypothetical protein V6R21_06255 [Limibacter armeniacum]|uniref:hypothetical protein n=1 Tax=Limibacter armeniacum TaxID=466084 RepID=UPI002FE6295C